MALTKAERQRIWRERYRGEPRGNKAMLAELTALQAVGGGSCGPTQTVPRKPTGRQRDDVAVLKQERDELAERLAQIEAFQPGIVDAARAWVAQVDAPSRRRRKR
jgi:hypothetical protein